MSFVELETDKSGLNHPIDAPPGILSSPPGKPFAAEDPPPIASPPEAFFSGADITPENIMATFPELTSIIGDVKTPLQQREAIDAELQQIFSQPVFSKKVKKYGRSDGPIPVPRSLEAATLIHSISTDIDSKVEHTRKGESFRVYWSMTRESKVWVLGTPVNGFKLPEQDTPYTLNGAGDDLEKRQDPFLPDGDESLVHENFVMFFAVNWDKLIPLFYDGPPPAKGQTMKRYVEVNLNNLALISQVADKSALERMGTVDFVGELPDGQLVVIEFRAPGSSKTKQIAKHTRGLQEILRLHNGSEAIPAISQYIATYRDRDQYAVVKLLPRRERFLPYTEEMADEVIYQATAAD